MKSQSLTSGSIPLQVRNLALPSSIGLFFQTMYNVVDSFYAGQLSTSALAALALSFPVYLLVLAIGGGLSRGSTALIANALGQKNESRQLIYVAQSISLGILMSLALTIFGLASQRLLFQLLGAQGDTLRLAMAYMTPIFLGGVFMILTNLSNAILIASGDSKTFSKVLVMGFFLNLILDPWFLYGGFGIPAMGIAGIAWATVSIQALGCMIMITAVVRSGMLNPKCFRYLKPNPKVYGEILFQAVPASFNIMSVAMGFFVITYFLKYFGESAVAAFGVTTRIEQIGLLPTFGLYAAIMALVGQNNGAGNYDRVRETMRVCNRAGLVLVLIGSLLIYLFSRPLIGLFTDDSSVIEIGIVYVNVMMLIQWSYVMTSTHLAFLQAIKRPVYGLFESVLRKVLLPLPLIYWLVANQGYPVISIWISMAVTNVLMTLITVVYAQVVLAKIDEPDNGFAIESG